MPIKKTCCSIAVLISMLGQEADVKLSCHGLASETRQVDPGLIS